MPEADFKCRRMCGPARKWGVWGAAGAPPQNTVWFLRPARSQLRNAGALRTRVAARSHGPRKALWQPLDRPGLEWPSGVGNDDFKVFPKTMKNKSKTIKTTELWETEKNNNN